MQKNCLLLFIFFISRLLLFSQTNTGPTGFETARIEIPAKSDQDSYRVLSCGDAGAMIFFKSTEMADGQKAKWYFSFYDKDLKQVWVKSLPVQNDLDFRHQLTSGDTVFLVFSYKGKQKSEDMPVEILRIIPSAGMFVPNLSRVPANSEPVFFKVKGRNAFFALNHKTGAPAIQILDLKTNRSKGFLIDSQGNAAFRWVEVDSLTGHIKVILSKPISKKEFDTWYHVFDTTGKVLTSINLTTINQDRVFVSFRSLTGKPGEEMLTGTYLLSSSASQKNKTADECSGVFTSLLSSGTQKNISFFNFLEFRHVGSLLNPKELLDLKKKALKKNQNIAEYSADFNVILHPPFEWKGQIIQASEVYSPQYHVENFTDFDFYGRPYTNSYSVFDGYKFNGAVVAGFSLEGQFLWDNSMEYRELISPELNPKLTVKVLNDNLLLAYSTQGRIGSKIIRDSVVTGNLEFSPLELKYPEDRLMAETRSGLLHWYQNYFLCYGFQDIKNISLPSNNRRLVFYLMKVKLEE